MRKWLTYFDNPTNGAGTVDQQERFYRLDYGPVTIIVLDVCNGNDADTSQDTSVGRLNTAAGCRAPDFNPGSVQYQWLESQLADAQTNSRFTFVSFHQVPYSVGYHGRPYPGDTQPGVPTRVLTNLFFRYGVDAVLSGHDEMYEHSQVTGTEVRPDGSTKDHTVHIYDLGIGGDGLRGVNLVSNPYETFRAHEDAPEQYDPSGVLTNGGKHYGHMEINVGTNAQGVWEATLTPVYVFVSTNTAGVVQGFDRRTYDDEEIVTEETRALTVVSDYGAPWPGVGTCDYAYGTPVEAWVGETDTQGTTQYLCTGWAGSGSVPVIGLETQVTFSVTNDSTLTWLWTTNYWLNTETNGLGTVSVADDWFSAGSSVGITASASAGYQFERWSGDTNGCEISGNTITAIMDQARTITAHFRSIDEQPVPGIGSFFLMQ